MNQMPSLITNHNTLSCPNLLPIRHEMVKNQTSEGLYVQSSPAVWYAHQCTLTAVASVAMSMETSHDDALTRVTPGHLFQGASCVMSSSEVPNNILMKLLLCMQQKTQNFNFNFNFLGTLHNRFYFYKDLLMVIVNCL